MHHSSLFRALPAALVFAGVAAHSVNVSASTDLTLDHKKISEMSFILSPAEVQKRIDGTTANFLVAKTIVERGGDPIEIVNEIRRQVIVAGGYALKEFVDMDISRDSVNGLDLSGAGNFIKGRYKGVEDKIFRQHLDASGDLANIVSRIERLGGDNAYEVKQSGFTQDHMIRFGLMASINGVVDLFGDAKKATRIHEDTEPYLNLIEQKLNVIESLVGNNPFAFPTFKRIGMTPDALHKMSIANGRLQAQSHFKVASELYVKGKDNSYELEKTRLGVEQAEGLANAGIKRRDWAKIGGALLGKDGHKIEMPESTLSIYWQQKIKPSSAGAAVLKI